MSDEPVDTAAPEAEEEKLFQQIEMTQGSMKALAWVEARAAILGASFDFTNGKGDDFEGFEDEESWTITEIYPFKLTSEQLSRMQRSDSSAFETRQ